MKAVILAGEIHMLVNCKNSDYNPMIYKFIGSYFISFFIKKLTQI